MVAAAEAAFVATSARDLAEAVEAAAVAAESRWGGKAPRRRNDPGTRRDREANPSIYQSRLYVQTL